MTGAATGPAGLDLPPNWRETAERLARGADRVLIAGPRDTGKSSFTRVLLHALAAAGRPALLLDADPGQKLVGPPGCVTLGEPGADGALLLRRLRFVGTTSATAAARIVDAAARLAPVDRQAALVINTPGLVRGPGAALLRGIEHRLRVDAVVLVGRPGELEGLFGGRAAPPVLLPSTAAVRRKSRAARALARRDAFAAHVAGAAPVLFDRARVRLVAPPRLCLREPWARPVCVLADGAGEDLGLGVLLGIEPGGMLVATAADPRAVAGIGLGEMWARPCAAGWILLADLLPAAGLG